MKKLLITTIFLSLFSLSDSFGQGKMTVREIHYYVSADGRIDKSIKTNERNLTFQAGRKLTKVENIRGLSAVDDRLDEYELNSTLRKSEKIYNDSGLVIECIEQLDSVSAIKCYISYNKYDDPKEVKSVYEYKDGTTSLLSTITYEYFYVCEMDSPIYTTNRKSYYRLGITPSTQGCPWFLRTVKKDGVVVQFVERKYRNG